MMKLKLETTFSSSLPRMNLCRLVDMIFIFFMFKNESASSLLLFTFKIRFCRSVIFVTIRVVSSYHFCTCVLFVTGALWMFLWWWWSAYRKLFILNSYSYPLLIFHASSSHNSLCVHIKLDRWKWASLPQAFFYFKTLRFSELSSYCGFLVPVEFFQ